MDKKLKNISKWLGTGSINFFGRPFSGKDTQGEIFAKLLNADLIGGGDIVRGYKNQDEITKVMANGGLIASEFYLEIVLPYLSQSSLKNRPLILSSVGRMIGEEDIIISATNTSGHRIKAIINLDLSEYLVWKRFEKSQIENDRGERLDDRIESLENRLKKFNELTIPVIKHYEALGLLINIDGEQTKLDVTQDIIDKLDNLAKTK